MYVIQGPHFPILEKKQKLGTVRGKSYLLLGFLRAQQRKSYSSTSQNNVSPKVLPSEGYPFFLSPFPPTSLVLFLWLPVSQFYITNSESGKSLIPFRRQKIDFPEQNPEFSLDHRRGVARARNTSSKKVCSVICI